MSYNKQTDEESKKSFNELKTLLKETVNNPAEMAGKLAEKVYKITQEDPEYILLAADQINHSLSKMTGKNIFGDITIGAFAYNYFVEMVEKTHEKQFNEV